MPLLAPVTGAVFLPVLFSVIVLPESARASLRDGLAIAPLSDASQVTTVIAWPPHSTSTGVAGLVRNAVRL